jgi:uncharacterized membrane protein
MPESLPPIPTDPVRSGPLAQIPLFAHLDIEQQADLFKSMHPRFVEANQTIFWMGDPGDSFYLVSTGRVAVTVPSQTGEHVILDTVGPGGFFGEISLLDGEPRTATLRAVEPSELYVLSRAHFHEFLVSHPRAAINILTIMGQRQRASTLALRGIKNPNQAFDETLTPGSWHVVADTIARVAASRNFLVIHIVWFGVWIALNIILSTGWFGIKAWDPFPFGLLTMIVSLEAIFLSIFVMVSQNRQAERDRLRTDLDYQVNVKAQTEIMEISRRLERIEKTLEKRS